MKRLRYLTAGESHGPALVAILEGLPAGLEVSLKRIADELARRRYGYGRGPRMKIEKDEIRFLSGVRGGKTLGSPLALLIENTEWAKWEHVMAQEGPTTGRALTRPRPGHADLVGMLKYDTDDARDILERASARETAARVGIGTVAKDLLASLGTSVISHVLAIGEAEIQGTIPTPSPEDLETIDASPVRCLDPGASDAMVAAIDAAAAEGDSLGGVIEVVAHGVPMGLGSHVHWDRKIDGRLAQGLMSIPGIKGVAIGDAFEIAQMRGSDAHDEIEGDLARSTSRAGGTEGGMTMGGLLRVRVAMKPLSTLKKRLRTVDMQTLQPAEAFQERTDTCAVPAAGVVAESVVALILADACLEAFGGSTMTDLVESLDRYRHRIETRLEP